MYEHRSAPLLPFSRFLRRLAGSFAMMALVVGAALSIGVVGYHVTAQLPWIDALLNASMILGGMGPVDPLKSTGGKLFASFYALFSGVIFLGAVGILLAPIVHRLLHQLHLDAGEGKEGAPDGSGGSPVLSGSSPEAPPGVAPR